MRSVSDIEILTNNGTFHQPSLCYFKMTVILDVLKPRMRLQSRFCMQVSQSNHPNHASIPRQDVVGSIVGFIEHIFFYSYFRPTSLTLYQFGANRLSVISVPVRIPPRGKSIQHVLVDVLALQRSCRKQYGVQAGEKASLKAVPGQRQDALVEIL